MTARVQGAPHPLDPRRMPTDQPTRWAEMAPRLGSVGETGAPPPGAPPSRLDGHQRRPPMVTRSAPGALGGRHGRDGRHGAGGPGDGRAARRSSAPPPRPACGAARPAPPALRPSTARSARRSPWPRCTGARASERTPSSPPAPRPPSPWAWRTAPEDRRPPGSAPETSAAPPHRRSSPPRSCSWPRARRAAILPVGSGWGAVHARCPRPAGLSAWPARTAGPAAPPSPPPPGGPGWGWPRSP